MPSTEYDPDDRSPSASARAHALFDLALTGETEVVDTGHPEWRLEHRASDHHKLVPGERVGRYKLVKVIGEGGFGVVWLAEQVEPFYREVALKLIKPGMDTRQVISRFETERQALALMDHSNIAAVLDAGTTSTDLPFFVMELVRDGLPITEYCDRKRLTVTERLNLFTSVCHGIQHAHQKGILHRDLKPSNILVTEVDGVPVPKVIDFGISKALNVGGRGFNVESTQATGQGMVIGTPLYMSPEQAGFGDLEADTRSDIYTLGAILYELLTGTTPLPADSIKRKPFDQVLRMVRENEAPRPSIRISVCTHQGTLGDVAQLRQTDDRKLAVELRGDLDWIVLRAIEKNPDRRYESAAALANDIVHHLNDEPVRARPPTTLYLVSKLIRRNRTAFLAGLVTTAGLVAGFWLAVLGYLREKKALERSIVAEQSAREESRKSQQVSAFLGNIFKDINQRNNRTLDPNALRDLIAAADERRRSELIDEPEVNARVSLILAEGYRETGGVRQASQLYQKALDLLNSTENGRSLEAADAMFWLAWISGHCEHACLEEKPLDLTQQLELLTQSREIRSSILGPLNDLTLQTQVELASVARREGRLDGAESILKPILARSTIAPANVATRAFAMREMALVYQARKKYEDADRLLQQSLSLIRNSALTLNNRAQAESEIWRLLFAVRMADNRVDEAADAAREEIDVSHRWLGFPEPAAYLRLSAAAVRLGRQAEALGHLQQAIDIAALREDHVTREAALRQSIQLRQSRGETTSENLVQQVTDLAKVLALEAGILKSVGRPPEAKLKEVDETLRLSEKLQPPYPQQAARLFEAHALAAVRRGQIEVALRDFEKASQSEPGKVIYVFQRAAAALASGQEAELKKTRAALLDALNRTQDVQELCRAARGILLVPCNKEELNKVEQRLQKAFTSAFVDNELDEEWSDWLSLVKGMIEFRAGRHAEATPWLNGAQSSGRPEIVAQALIVSAMNQKKLGQDDDAFRSYMESSVSMPPNEEHEALPDATETHIQDVWIHQALLREAEKMGLGKAANEEPATPAPTSAIKPDSAAPPEPGN